MNHSPEWSKQMHADPHTESKTIERILDLLDQWDRDDGTDDPEELERRRADFEEFKAAINASHSSNRKIYP